MGFRFQRRISVGDGWSVSVLRLAGIRAQEEADPQERFLAEMEAVVPWAALLAVIEPHDPTTGRRGRPPMPMSTMLRVYFMQQWYALSDAAMEDALYEIESMRRFAGLELSDDATRRPRRKTRSANATRDALHEKGQPMVLWHEYPRGC